MYAVIPAAGSGSRMGEHAAQRSKVLIPILADTSALELSLSNLLRSDVFTGIVIALRPEDRAEVEQLLARIAPNIEVLLVNGGDDRQSSVLSALIAIDGKCSFVAVHDAARAFCAPELIRAVVQSAQLHGAAILATPSIATLKQVGDDRKIKQTLNRDSIWEAQTPQVFRFDLLREAHRRAEQDRYCGTDDASLVERCGVGIAVVPGSPRNIKLTTPEDLAYARYLLSADYKSRIKPS